MSLDIPPSFAFCQNDDCHQSQSCLHFLAYGQLPQDRLFIPMVNPACYPQGQAPCPAFCSNKPMQQAWGIKGIFDQIPHATARRVKAQIIAELGKTFYYRVYREERPLLPHHQEIIQRIFSLHGIDQPPSYHRLIQVYQWFPQQEP